MRRFFLILLVVVVAAAVVAFLAFRADINAANARLTGRSETVQTSFGTVEYATAGEGTPVLAIHGSGGGFDQGLEMTAPLATAGHRIVAPSRFGYLRSKASGEIGVAKQADAFAELLDQLGLPKVFVFGGSAGALSAIEFAIRHPERCAALVLMVPATYSPDRKPNTSGAEGGIAQSVVRTLLGSDFAFWLALKVAPSSMTRLILATDPAIVAAASPQEQQRVAEVLRHILPISRRVEGLVFDGMTAGAPEPAALERITCPVLAISLEDDLYGTAAAARYVASQVPGAKLVIYPSGGHIWVGHQEEVWREIDAFMREVSAKG